MKRIGSYFSRDRHHEARIFRRVGTYVVQFYAGGVHMDASDYEDSNWANVEAIARQTVGDE